MKIGLQVDRADAAAAEAHRRVTTGDIDKAADDASMQPLQRLGSEHFRAARHTQFESSFVDPVHPQLHPGAERVGVDDPLQLRRRQGLKAWFIHA